MANRIRFFLGMFLVLAPLAGAQEPEPNFDLVISREMLPYLVSHVPEKYLGYPLREKLGIPAGITPEEPPRRFSSETKEAFQARLAKQYRPTVKEVCEFGNHTKALNNKFAELADRCGTATGTRFCVRVNGLLKACESALDELNRGSAAIAMFPPAQWRMMTESTLSAFGQVVPPKLDPEKIGYRKIRVHLPGIEIPGQRLGEIDLGEIYVAWNKTELQNKIADARKVGVPKAVAALDGLLHPKSADEKSPALDDAIRRLFLTQATNGAFKTVDRALMAKVFCSDSDREPLLREREREVVVQESAPPEAHASEIAKGNSVRGLRVERE